MSPQITQPDTGDDFISLDELCEMAHMGKHGYQSLRRQGRTPTAYKMGRRLFFRRDEAEEWLRNERIVRIEPPRRIYT